MPSDHTHGEHADWSDQLAMLEREGGISLPWLRQAIGWLTELAAGSIRQVIDVGSGPGSAAVLLAEQLPEAQVVAFDGNQVLLDRALARAAEHGVAARFVTRQGHIGAQLADLPPADLVWAARVVHHLTEPREGLRALGQVLTEEGLLALVEGGLPMRVLPGGYGVGPASLPSRLDAAAADWATDIWGMTEAAMTGERDWPLLLTDAGLQHVASRTFVLDLPAPLDDATRDFVVQRFLRTHEHMADRLSPPDAAAVARLVDPSDAAALVNRPDLFVLTAHTVHVARRG